LGCHADEALKLIDTADIQEQNILGAFKFQPNTIYLHSDETFMPKRRAAWASWVYMQEQKKRVDDTGIALTYWMNNLQNIKTEEQYFVTLNPTKPLLLHKTYNVYQFSHPIFDVGAIQAQSKIMDIQGKRNMWFCGAWQRYGFHEDGLWSALRVVDILHKG
jgi:predicted NAD/FAD-binding protein